MQLSPNWHFIVYYVNGQFISLSNDQSVNNNNTKGLTQEWFILDIFNIIIKYIQTKHMLELPKGSVLTYELGLYRKIINEVIIFIHNQNVYQVFKKLKSLNHLT